MVGMNTSLRGLASVTLLSVALLVGCGRHHRPFRHVVLVTIDTLRADHLSAYGYPRKTSPFLDSLAREGVAVRRATAPMASTIPSHATLFTSLYPLQTGVVRNGIVLKNQFVTLAELFRDSGYATAAFVSANHLAHAQLNQGFDIYSGRSREQKPYRTGDLTVDVALDWLGKQQPDARSFVWIHLFDPHRPHHVREPQQDAIQRDSPMTDRQFSDFLENDYHVDPTTFRDGEEQMIEDNAGYDGEIRFADAQLKRFFEAMKSRGSLSDTLWIVTSDHGEGMGNHHWKGHGKHIYNEQVHVPLIFWSGDQRWAPHWVQSVVEHVDLLPTLMEIQGLDGPDRSPSDLRPQGASMVPLLQGDPQRFPVKVAFSQRRSYANRIRPRSPQPNRNYEAGHRYAVQSKRYKYFLWTAGQDEFYDLKHDPYEIHNLIDDNIPQAAELRRDLVRRVDLYRNAAPTTQEVDEEGMEQLRALGYVQ